MRKEIQILRQNGTTWRAAKVVVKCTGTGIKMGFEF